MTKALAQKAVSSVDAASEEWLSALLDGELDDDEARGAIGRLSKETEAMTTWSEYSLIGDAMRGCRRDVSRFDNRFKAALAAEPTILAPVAKPARQPVYWVAAATVVVAITWTVLSVSPGNPGPGLQVASNNVAPTAQIQPVSAQGGQVSDVTPYLTAHQDYAFMVGGEPDMHITPVSLSGDAR